MCVHVNVKVKETFGVDVDVTGVMSPWLFNIDMDGCMRKVKVSIGILSIRTGSAMATPLGEVFHGQSVGDLER